MTPVTSISPDEDAIDRRGHKGADRRCVGTDETKPKSEMIRFVKGPDNQLVPDLAGKLPGRGVWIQAKSTALELAMKNGGFKRGLKSNVDVSPELLSQTTALLKSKLLSLMPMAMKAGQIHIGFDQVKAAAQTEILAWRVEALDGSEGGRGKIRVLTRAVSLELGQKPTPVIGCFTSNQLGQSIGRPDIVHAAIKKGPMKKSFDQAAARLSGFCQLVPENWPDRKHERTENYPVKLGDKG